MRKINTHTGLTQEEVNTRIKENKVNITTDNLTKSYKQIILTNTITLFNIINIILAILVIITGQYHNMLFMGVVISNTVIGIIQEIRAKKALDKLRLINQPHVDVIRDSTKQTIKINEIVIDDIIELNLGNQICTDGILLEGNLEVDESQITGEANLIIKNANDMVYSGSFVASGNGLMQVTNVGDDNFIQTIIKEATRNKIQPSKLRDSLNYIIKIVTILIIPVGLCLFCKQYFITNLSINDSILQTVAALVGMIPEGLILLTSVALAVGSINLAKDSVLVQELYCLETLARVDTLCLDKTGTLTYGKMRVEDIIPLDQSFDINNILANIVQGLNDNNSTSKAIENATHISSHLNIISTIHFSSTRKHCAISLENESYILGAYNFTNLNIKDELINRIKHYADIGNRVLVLSHNPNPFIDTINQNNEPIALILLKDAVRLEAKATLDFFDKQGVNIKIISGDDFNTVKNIATQAGVKHAEKAIDCSKVTNDELKYLILENNVFGRVTPEQKQLMIKSLKENGHTVGMVGDGVNDVMALKEADTSIAMFEGSDAAKNIANIVLLDSNFKNMPSIVNEGRRVINNIQRTSTLFLTKTIFSIFLSLITLVLIDAYPFVPIQLTLLSTLCIGIPAFILSLEPDHTIVSGNFLANVLAKAIPSGISIVISIMMIQIISYIFKYSLNIQSSIAVIVTGIIMFTILVEVAGFKTKLRKILISIIAITLFSCLFLFGRFFEIYTLTFHQIAISFVIASISILILKQLNKCNLSYKLTKKLKL